MNLQPIIDTIRETLKPLTPEDRCKIIAAVVPSLADDVPHTRADIERAIASTVDLNGAAAQLGCSRRTLNNYMTKFGLPPGKGGRRSARKGATK